mmetsp:Transcript_44514/g.142732  ORF Transcript_44514/g.142732 Transcript_44514/m.142732 type:complete len:283 (+) Transcript_44514:910-1758(+)
MPVTASNTPTSESSPPTARVGGVGFGPRATEDRRRACSSAQRVSQRKYMLLARLCSRGRLDAGGLPMGPRPGAWKASTSISPNATNLLVHHATRCTASVVAAAAAAAAGGDPVGAGAEDKASSPWRVSALQCRSKARRQKDGRSPQSPPSGCGAPRRPSDCTILAADASQALCSTACGQRASKSSSGGESERLLPPNAASRRADEEGGAEVSRPTQQSSKVNTASQQPGCPCSEIRRSQQSSAVKPVAAPDGSKQPRPEKPRPDIDQPGDTTACCGPLAWAG